MVRFWERCLSVIVLTWSVPRMHATNAATTSEREKKVVVIGAGYSGLAAACELQQLGYEVTLLEKNGHIGGRANMFTTEDGFTFDAGPSWYWMPEVFERFFERYGRNVDQYYQLTRLDPAYRIITSEEEENLDVPGTWEGFLAWASDFEGVSPISLGMFFQEAKEKYEKGIFEWIWKPMFTLWDLLDINLGLAALKFDMFGSLVSHIKKYVTNPKLLTVLKWPVIFIGAAPDESPALYSLMTYAGHAFGTWYPSGGMAAPARAMGELAKELGVKIELNAEVSNFVFDRDVGDRIVSVCTKNQRCIETDGVIASGDYYHIEQNLLPEHLRRYGEEYWARQTFSPSCLLYYLGFDRKIDGLLHHTFFFDVDLDKHLRAAFVDHRHTDQPTFYVSTTSKTDPSVTPHGSGEALFVLIPISYRLNGTDTSALMSKFLDLIIGRMEKSLHQPLREHLVYQKMYGPHNFEADFHSFRGNAFGHANTLLQSLIFKPSMDSIAPNLVFAGHLTNPGPGVPPAIVSGTVAAQVLDQKISSQMNHSTRLSWLTQFSICVGIAHLALWILVAISKRRSSYLLCVKLLFQHGKTYFAAATLMNTQRFLDTAAMYGLFRIADDFVDNEDSPHERSTNLEQFISDFWRCWEKGEGEYGLHPALPAIIESSKRHKYPRELFEKFFRSMRMDIGEMRCQSLDETMDYMEGSAAVIGEFMLPILMPHATAEERMLAHPHARDLGIAFQLTNMIRDIGEDLDLGRQYIPENVCNRYHVRLVDRNKSQPGFVNMIEEMIQVADKYYNSAEIGVGMLPNDVNDVIRVAMLAYHRIHEKIRELGHDVFSARARVPFREKLSILISHVSLWKLFRILFVELYVRTLYFLSRTPTLLVLFGLCVSNFVHAPLCTYLGFHFVFVVPALVFLAYSVSKHVLDGTLQQKRHLHSALLWTSVLCVVAIIYTTPWDNYLVYKGIWGYFPNRVLFTIGFVPVEEYGFFVLETLLCGLLWLSWFWNAQELHLKTQLRPKHAQAWRYAGFTVLAILFCIGVVLLIGSSEGMYMGLILVWCTPVLLVQWAFGSTLLLIHWSEISVCVFSAASFLCIADRWAIHHRIWWIKSSNTFPEVLIKGLPVEEATFFFCTSTMCIWGLSLAMIVSKYQDAHRSTLFESALAVFRWGLHENIGQQQDPSRSAIKSKLQKKIDVHFRKRKIERRRWAFLVTGSGVCLFSSTFNDGFVLVKAYLFLSFMLLVCARVALSSRERTVSSFSNWVFAFTCLWLFYGAGALDEASCLTLALTVFLVCDMFLRHQTLLQKMTFGTIILCGFLSEPNVFVQVFSPFVGQSVIGLSFVYHTLRVALILLVGFLSLKLIAGKTGDEGVTLFQLVLCTGASFGLSSWTGLAFFWFSNAIDPRLELDATVASRLPSSVNFVKQRIA